jgi:hypothetical protein
MPDVGFPHGAWKVLRVACYVPLPAWAPLLGTATWAYGRRRAGGSNGACTVPQGASQGATSARARSGSR